MVPAIDITSTSSTPLAYLSGAVFPLGHLARRGRPAAGLDHGQPRISIDRLCSDQVLKHLSSVVHWPVFRWNSTGLTYAVLFRPPPELARLPANAPLNLDEAPCRRDERPRGRYKLGLGLSQRGPEWYGLEKMNHVMVAGETDAGKSTFLRSLVYQVLHWERPVTLYLSDRVGATFAPVAGVPQLGAPIARTVEEVLDIGKMLSDEMSRRDQLFLEALDYPEKLSEYHHVGDATLPLVLWIIDKAPAFLNMSEGRNGVLARIWSDVAQQSRKYGIYLVLASHDWRADALPPTLKSAMKTRVVFRQVDGMSKRSGPERIGAAQKGRAWCLSPDGYREVQTYFVAKRQLIERCDELRVGSRQLTSVE